MIASGIIADSERPEQKPPNIWLDELSVEGKKQITLNYPNSNPNPNRKILKTLGCAREGGVSGIPSGGWAPLKYGPRSPVHKQRKFSGPWARPTQPRGGGGTGAPADEPGGCLVMSYTNGYSGHRPTSGEEAWFVWAIKIL